MDACPDGHMFRFDCCAGSDTKIRLSEGQPGWHPDPRAMEIMLEFPRELIPIWSRPWINARIIGGYPVEYRVFVYDGQAMGVSNYYARPLHYDRRHIDAIGQYTQALTAVIDPPLLWNYSPFRDHFDSHFDTEGVHFTADYIVDADDNVAFLEGGPPHHLGAHPCCFPMGETQGLALTLTRPEKRNPRHQPMTDADRLINPIQFFEKLSQCDLRADQTSHVFPSPTCPSSPH